MRHDRRTAARAAAALLRPRLRRAGGVAGARARAAGARRRVGRSSRWWSPSASSPADRRLRPGDLAVRRVPARFVPPDALGGAGELAGARTAVPVAAGGYLTAGMLGGGAPAAARGPLRAGERALELAVAGGGALAGAGPGARVDVLVTSRARGRAPGGRSWRSRTWSCSALRAGGERASGGGGRRGRRGAHARSPRCASRARQAVYLTAAANFAARGPSAGPAARRPPADRAASRSSAKGGLVIAAGARPAAHPAPRPTRRRCPSSARSAIPMNRPCSTTPGHLLHRDRQRVQVRVGGQRAVQDQVALVRHVGLAVVAQPLLGVRQQLRPGGGACRASRSAPPRPAAGNARPAAPPASTSSATTTKRRAAEITIFSRSSAPPPPLIRRSSGSTSSAPSSARSSSTVPSSSTTSNPARARQLLRARGSHRRPHGLARGRQQLDDLPDRPAGAEPDRHPGLDQLDRCGRGGAARAASSVNRPAPLQLDRRDRGERPGHRAVLLGLLGDLLELVVLDVRPPARVCPARSARIDGAGLRRLEVHGRGASRRVSASWPARPEVGGQRHREAARVSRRDQLLGLVPSPSWKRDWNEYGPS